MKCWQVCGFFLGYLWWNWIEESHSQWHSTSHRKGFMCSLHWFQSVAVQCSADCSCNDDAPKNLCCSRFINSTKTHGSGDGLRSCQDIPEYLCLNIPNNCSWQGNCIELSQEVQNHSLSQCSLSLNCSDHSGFAYLAVIQPCLTVQTRTQSNSSTCLHCECPDTVKIGICKQTTT